MELLSYISIGVVIVTGILEMILSNNTVKGKDYSKISKEKRKELFSCIKDHWKEILILLAVTIALMLMKMGLNSGNVSRYIGLVNNISIGLSAIFVITIILRGNKFRNRIKEVMM